MHLVPLHIVLVDHLVRWHAHRKHEGRDTVVRELMMQASSPLKATPPILMAPPLSSCQMVARESPRAALTDWKTSKGTDPVEAANSLPESMDTCALRFKQNSDAFSIVSSSL